jgi:hypothetical protein
MLEPVPDLPHGVVGLKAKGIVIAQDIAQALLRARKAPDAGSNVGFVLFIDPDLDGYLAEIVSGLSAESEAESPSFQRWALVAPDGVISEVERYQAAAGLRIFAQSRSHDAVAWVSAKQ